MARARLSRRSVLVVGVGESSGAVLALTGARARVFFLLELSGQAFVVSKIRLVGIGVIAVQSGFVGAVAGC